MIIPSIIYRCNISMTIIVVRLPAGNGFRSVRREIGKPSPPVFLNGHALPQQKMKSFGMRSHQTVKGYSWFGSGSADFACS